MKLTQAFYFDKKGNEKEMGKTENDLKQSNEGKKET